MADNGDGAADPRIDELRAEFRDQISRLERAISSGSRPRVERASRALEDEFSEDEIRQLRETREYERFRRMAERYGDELEREARLAGADNGDEEEKQDEPDAEEEEDDEEGDEAAVPARPQQKAKKPAKPRPRGGRHPKPEPVAEPEPAKGLLSWLVE